MSDRLSAWVGLAAAAGLALVIFGPALLPSYFLSILVLAVIAALIAVGLNLLMGYTGLDSLGQAAFFGSAAYFLGITTVKYGAPWWLGAIGGLVLATALAALFGLVAVRLRGLYFLLITLAFAQVLWGVTLRWGTFTGGWNGLPGVSRPHPLLQNSLSFYYLALIVLSVVMACVWLISRSPFGLILRGIRENELRSSTLGIQTRWHKYVVFVIAGVVAAIAGVLNASYIGFVSPRDLSVELSFDAMLMVIVGGAGTLAGPAIGAFLVTALRYLLSVYVPNYWLIVLGTVFIAVTIWLPDGVVGVGRRLRRFSHATSEPDFAALVSEHIAPVEPSTSEPPRRKTMASNGPSATGDAVASEGASLILSQVAKIFGDVRVLRDVSFAVGRGERVGIIGLNGAGKTTLFNVISGIHNPTGGKIELFGEDVTTAPVHIRSRRGLARTFQVTTLYPKLSVIENVMTALIGSRFRSYQYSMWRTTSRVPGLMDAALEILETLGLEPLKDEEVRHLSYGHQRQVEIALALALDPKVLLLDEPTAGLSQAEIPRMLKTLTSLPADLSVLLVEHNLEVIFEMVDRVVVLHQGEVFRDGRPEEIRNDPEVRDLYFGLHTSSGGRTGDGSSV